MESSDKVQNSTEYAVFPVRWFIILAAVLLVIGTHVCFIAFNPVVYESATFFNATTNQVTYFASVGFPMSFVFGFISIWIYDRYGLYWPLMVGSWSATLGCALRLVAVYIEEPSYTMAFLSQVLNGIGSPMVSMCSTKLANVWFPLEQTALANSLVSSAMPVGIVLAYVISPTIVTSDFTATDFQTLTWIYATPLICGTTLMSICLPWKTGRPAVAPNNVANVESLPFGTCLKQLFTNPMYMLIVLCGGSGIGFFNVFLVNAPLMLCPMGFSALYAQTLSIVIVVGSGVIGSTAVGAILVKKKDYLVPIARIGTVLLALSAIGVAYTTTSEVEYVGTTIALVVMGATGIMLLPVCFELCVETTFPIGPATSSGISWICGQLLATIFTIISAVLRKEITTPMVTNNCSDEGTDYDYQVGMFVLAGLVCLFCGSWVIFYRCPFKRRNYDGEVDVGRVNPAIDELE